MKKLLSIVLALVMVLSLSVTAFAADSPQTITDTTGTDITVTGTYVAGEATADMISVTVAWEAMNFTYTGASKGTWNPGTHTYDGATSGGWSENTPAITVTNHSNVAVNATLGFSAAKDVNITGTFTESSGTGNDNVLELATAVGTKTGTAPSASANFGISGEAIEKTQQLGTITVTIAKNGSSADEDNPTVVTTYEALAAAVSSGGDVKLGADIDMGSNTLTLASGTQGTIDLGGHELSASTSGTMITVGSNAEYTFKNGTISDTTSLYAIQNKGTLTINGCTVTGLGMVLSQASGSTTLTNTSLISTGTPTLINPGGNSTLTFSGIVNLTYTNGTAKIMEVDTATITILPGTYNFDPSSYDTGSYTATNNGDGTWTVA